MSFNVSNQIVNKTQSYRSDSAPYGGSHKSTATSQQGNDVGLWIEQNRHIYDAIMNGTADLSPTDQGQFMEWWNWAYAQMGQGTGANGWDPMGAGDPNADATGGQEGATGNTVWDEETVDLTYTGGEGVNDVYAFHINVLVPSTAVNVKIENTTDSRLVPPEDVFKVTFFNKATGKEEVAYLHNKDAIENIKIFTPNGLNVENLTGDNRIQVGEYKEGATESDGIPDIAEIEGDTATYTGTGGNLLEFEFPFGAIPNHIIHSNAKITVPNDCEVLVERQADGGFEVTVTDPEGNETHLTIPAGFELRLRAHPPMVTFKNGQGSGGDIDGLAVEGGGVPQRTTPSLNGADGVPVGWEKCWLNGDTAPEAPDPTVDLPEELVNLFDLMGIDPSDPNLNLDLDKWVEEVEKGVMPPDDALLDALLANDQELKDRWENYQANPGDDFAMKQVRDRLEQLLSAIFDDVSKSGEFPEGIEPDALLESRTIWFGEVPFELTDSFSFDRVMETDGVGESDEPGAEAQVEDAQAIAQSLADLGEIQWTAEEILERAEEIGINLGSIHLTFPPQPADEDKLIQLLYDICPAFKAKLDAFADGERVTEGEIVDLRNALTGLLDVVYSISGYSFTGHDDDTGEGHRENDVWVYKNGERVSRWNMFRDGGDGFDAQNPWTIFTWDFHAYN